MANEKYILVSLDDEKVSKIADILGNKTCKKILDFLADKNEASETDISKELGMALNTIEYNIKKLLDAGLVEKAKNFFWSTRGRKIDMYKLAKKHIVISHKMSKPSYSKLKSIVPVALLSGAAALILRFFYQSRITEQVFEESVRGISTVEKVVTAPEAAGAGTLGETANIAVSFADKILALPVWLWFLAGSLLAIVIMLLLNWRKL